MPWYVRDHIDASTRSSYCESTSNNAGHLATRIVCDQPPKRNLGRMRQFGTVNSKAALDSIFGATSLAEQG
jgi:hypothetical protein